MTVRCPYCGLAVVGALPNHVAFSEECAAAQITETLWGSAQPLGREDGPA